MGSQRVGHDWSDLAAAAAYPFSSRSSRPRNLTGVSCIAGRFFTNWAIREAWKLCHLLWLLAHMAPSTAPIAPYIPWPVKMTIPWSSWFLMWILSHVALLACGSQTTCWIVSNHILSLLPPHPVFLGIINPVLYCSYPKAAFYIYFYFNLVSLFQFIGHFLNPDSIIQHCVGCS